MTSIDCWRLLVFSGTYICIWSGFSQLKSRFYKSSQMMNSLYCYGNRANTKNEHCNECKNDRNGVLHYLLGQIILQFYSCQNVFYPSFWKKIWFIDFSMIQWYNLIMCIVLFDMQFITKRLNFTKGCMLQLSFLSIITLFCIRKF